MIMSALESPSTMPPVWQDPSWPAMDPSGMAAVATASTTTASAAAHAGQHMMHPHHHHPHHHPHHVIHAAAAASHEFYQQLHTSSAPMTSQVQSAPISSSAPIVSSTTSSAKDAVNAMNSSSNSDNSSVNSNGGKNHNNNNKRTVNFKLEIKPEPPGSTNGDNELQNTGMQKVPSISDLSDPESSLDIIPSQVGKLEWQKTTTRMFSFSGEIVICASLFSRSNDDGRRAT